VGGEDRTARGADQTGTGGEARQRFTVPAAAEILGITAEAVRTRIKRGKLDSVKNPDRPGGTVYVLLGADQTRPNTDPTVKGQDQTSDQTVAELRDRIAYLERQVEEEREARRRADTILAQLSQANAEQARTIRAIEAPSFGAAPTTSESKTSEDASESPESPGPSETPADARGGPETATEPPEERGWFRRFFGLD
jgi:hypothetical protein